MNLKYEYAKPVGALPSIVAPRPPLSQLIVGLPPELANDLKIAALAARARRIEELAERVATHSEAAAVAIRDLVRTFRYDLIVRAVDERAGEQRGRGE